ncbi:MAG: hypothetical protein Kow0074_09220 [Candidatus Zixiibacteriota bacterium]
MGNETLMNQWSGTPFPDMIRDLPEADIPFDGVRGWLHQGGAGQIVFFDIQEGMEVPPHAHGAQWGVVVEGRMVLTLDGTPHTIRKGDWYYIPAGVVHSATFPMRSQVIDVFADVGRYKPRSA